MRWVFAGSLVLGVLALIGVVMRASRPQASGRIPARFRRIVAGAVAFGMGGLSAAYAGWHVALATLAAVAVAAAVAWYAGSSGAAGGREPG